MRPVGTEERRARLAVRHHLATAAAVPDVATVARDLVGIHSTDAASVYLGAFARLTRPQLDHVAHVEHALYEHRRVARVLGMRRTMFVLPTELVPVVHHACTVALSRNERRRTVTLIEGAGVAPPGQGEGWLRRVEQATLDALARRGEAVATELSADVPELRVQIPFGEGKKWAGTQGVSTRVLFLLAAEGRVVRARPRGSWLSTQYRWAVTGQWLGHDIPDVPEREARVELARHYLSRYGPATAADVKWWTGWTGAETKAALAGLDPEPVQLDGGAEGWVLADDVERVERPDPEAWLLPALDTTVMGWTGRAWFLGPHGPTLFDRNGNAGPTVWWDGRVVGGWGQRADGEIAVRLLEKVDRGAERAVAVRAAALRSLLGDVRVVPRFRTPLERELSA